MQRNSKKQSSSTRKRPREINSNNENNGSNNENNGSKYRSRNRTKHARNVNRILGSNPFAIKNYHKLRQNIDYQKQLNLAGKSPVASVHGFLDMARSRRNMHNRKVNIKALILNDPELLKEVNKSGRLIHTMKHTLGSMSPYWTNKNKRNLIAIKLAQLKEHEKAIKAQENKNAMAEGF
jgi:hypothetical protein